MPTYEYACASCGHTWEQVQRITEPPTELCPKCAALSAHRLISGGTNFILKGGGWYSDLYSSPKKEAEKKAPSGAEAPKPDAPKADAPKTESKGDSASSGPSAASSSGTPTPSTSSSAAS